MTCPRYCLLLSIAAVLAGCRTEDSGDASSLRVMVFAAASVTDALDEINARFRREHGVEVRANYAATSMLAQQVVHGAGADVFVSANRKWVDVLEENKQVARRRDLLGNRLVIVTAADSPGNVRKPEDLLCAEVRHLAMADPEAVPAGIYAKAALGQLGLWEQLEPKVVASAHVRQVLAYVKTGAAEAGVVYATDAAVEPSVRVAVPLEVELTEPIRYAIALLREGTDNPAAAAYYKYLAGLEAREVFHAYGFEVLGEP